MKDERGRDLPLDAHLHSRASADADPSVDVDTYAALAVELGIAEIAITDHVDFDPRWPNHGVDVVARERVVREAADRWAGHGVAIRFGVEVTYESLREDEIREHLARWPYDFVIGSVHIGPDSVYHVTRVGGWVAGRDLGEIIEPYFDEVRAAAGSGLFDAIGHLDFVKRYLVPHIEPGVLDAALELYDPVLRALVESGTALEVNTSGLRQAAGETYPGPAAISRYRELGGRSVTIGSDAHRAEWFAHGLEDGYRRAGDAGFRSVVTGRREQRRRIAIPERVHA